MSQTERHIAGLIWNILLPISDITIPNQLKPATTPALKTINLIIPDKVSGAWTIKVENPLGVTVHDVLQHISQGLHRPVYEHEIQWCGSDQKRIEQTYRNNRSLMGTQLGANLRRVDFLDGRNVFAGLSRDYGKVGMPMWMSWFKPAYGEEMFNFWVVELRRPEDPQARRTKD